MAKPKPVITMRSYGLYTAWDKKSKALPKVIKHTLEIPVTEGVEFGFILSIKKAKGDTLEFCIDHPPILDERGELMPPFKGSYFIDSNDFEFFLGDTVWEPLEEKKGVWTLTVKYKEIEVARKVFTLI